MSSTPTGGSPRDLALAGQTAFVADQEAGLLAYDISDPAAPQHLSTLTTDDGFYAIGVMDGYALLGGEQNLTIVDVTNPVAPSIVSTLPLPGAALDICIADGVAYVPTHGAGLTVVDVSTPANPAILSEFNPGYSVSRVSVSNGVAYLGLGSQGLRVLDVTDPGNLVQVGALDEIRVYDMGIDGTLLFASTRESWPDSYGVATIDVSQPSQPRLLGRSDPISRGFDLTLANGKAYLGGASTIYDIHDPAAPVLLGRLPHTGRHSAIRNSLAFAVDDAALTVVDVSDPTSGGPTAFVQVWDTEGLAVRGNYAFISSWDDGLLVFNIADPDNPIQLASLDLPNPAHHLDVEGDYAFVAITGVGLAVVDVSDPVDPRLVVPPTQYASSRVDVADGVAVTIGSRLCFLDVSDPLHPTPLASHPYGGYYYHGAACVAGGYAYVAIGMLRVFDLSDPQADPVATIDSVPAANAVDVQGDLACVAGRYDFVLYDVSDPADPRLLGRMDLPGDTAQSLRIDQDRVLLGLSAHGLWVVDISDRSDPELVASTDNWVDGRAIYDLEVRGHAAMMVSGDGFRVLDLSDCPCPADFNTDGTVDTQDFLAFLAAWADQRDDDCSSGDCSADLNADGTVNTQDFIEFLSLWAAGC